MPWASCCVSVGHRSHAAVATFPGWFGAMFVEAPHVLMDTLFATSKGVLSFGDFLLYQVGDRTKLSKRQRPLKTPNPEADARHIPRTLSSRRPPEPNLTHAHACPP